MIKHMVVASALALTSSLALAAPPACDDATDIFAPSTVSGTTVGLSGGIEQIGPISIAASGQKVWKFVAGNDVTGSFKVNGADGWAWALFTSNQCGAAIPSFIDGVAVGDTADNTLTLTSSQYTPGTTYYVILAAALAGVNMGMPGEGPFDIEVTPTLPVTLQSFEVE